MSPAAIIKFLKTDVWRIRARDLPPGKYLPLRILRVVLLALRGFVGDKRQLNAASLTFFTLISIVPVMSLAFAIARGFGLERVLEQQILARFPEYQDVISQIIVFSDNLLMGTRGGVIAGVGVLILFWIVIGMLSHIEEAFNEIWGIKKARGFQRKVSDYLFVALVSPFFVIFSSGLTVVATTQIREVLVSLHIPLSLIALVQFGFYMLPFLIMCGLFTFLYTFMPNTHVRLPAGIVGGVIAGILYQVGQVIYIAVQTAIGTFDAVYGTFAAVPLFMIWLQISWRIVLFGAEMSFSHQSVETYEFEEDALKVSAWLKRLLTLEVVTVIVKRFAVGQEALTAAELSRQLDLPVRLLEGILFDLTSAGIISEVRAPGARRGTYQPSVDIHRLTISCVTEMLDKKGSADIPYKVTPELINLRDSIRDLEARINRSPFNRRLMDL